MPRDLDYENNNIAYDEQYPIDTGGGIKCKNYEICEAVLPKWWYDCKGRYLCTNCDIFFGTWGVQTGKGELKIYNNLECPICLENKKSISQPFCDHTVCIECFKRCWYGDPDTSGEPEFPHPDIEDEYDEGSDEICETLESMYPLIKTYNENWDKWDDERNIKRNNEENLRKCPVCRN